MIALFIGRFQPFHIGHLSVVKDIDKGEDVKEIIIGIGSSQYSGTEQNPYSFEERKKMIEMSLSGKIKHKCRIIAVPDIHDPQNWVGYVRKTVGHFDVVYTANDFVKKLFKERGHKVKPINIKINISATELRKKIKQGDDEWTKFIPSEARNLISHFSQKQIRAEAGRLYDKLHHTCWTEEECAQIAPLTLEINELKKKRGAIILAHSYQSPEIMYGVADYVGDSYGLSKIASKTNAKKIIFCSVYFMGETAKILNPKKEVLVPAVSGCSLAESITPKDVKKLRRKHPHDGVVCYINTYAAVKAECDICCTSSNALKVIESLPQDEIIFLPDKLMGKNLQKHTKKKLILWNGTCVVHENFNAQSILRLRRQYPNVKILAHTECAPAIVDHADMAGSTNDILKYVETTKAKDLMLVTECGITDRVRTEFKDKNIVGTCNLCPYMKKITLKDVLAALKKPNKSHVVALPKNVLKKAKRTLDKMLEII